MKFVIAAAILTALLPTAVSFASATWTNEPFGSTRVLDWSFDQTQNGKGAGYVWDVYSSGRIVSDPTAPLSPSNVLKSSISAGATSGGVQLEYITPEFHNELFVGFYWRTNPEFWVVPPPTNCFSFVVPKATGFGGLAEVRAIPLGIFTLAITRLESITAIPAPVSLV